MAGLCLISHYVGHSRKCHSSVVDAFDVADIVCFLIIFCNSLRGELRDHVLLNHNNFSNFDENDNEKLVIDRSQAQNGRLCRVEVTDLGEFSQTITIRG